MILKLICRRQTTFHPETVGLNLYLFSKKPTLYTIYCLHASRKLSGAQLFSTIYLNSTPIGIQLSALEKRVQEINPAQLEIIRSFCLN